MTKQNQRMSLGKKNKFPAAWLKRRWFPLHRAVLKIWNPLNPVDLEGFLSPNCEFVTSLEITNDGVNILGRINAPHPEGFFLCKAFRFIDLRL